MKQCKLLIICVLFLSLCIEREPALAEEPGPVCSIQLENDMFGGGTDRHFTHGSSLNCLTSPIPLITDAAAGIPWFDPEEIRKNPLQARASLTIGQNMYTPEDISGKDLQRKDRPYAGWLYAGFGIVANQGSRRYDKIELDIGIIGPQSYAGDVQKKWHSIFGFQRPNGWKHQLGNEPGIVLIYEQARRFDRRNLFLGLDYDTIFHFGGSLGNVFTYGNAGFTLRVGQALEKDFGPPRIRPSLPGSGYFLGKHGFSRYLFAGMDGRAVVRNIFLDGNTFTDSHSVDKNFFVGDFQTGLALQVHRLRVAYTQIFRTKEFKGQNSPDEFGALSISYRF